MPLTEQLDFSMNCLQPQFDARFAQMRSVAFAPSLTILKGTILGELSGTNAVQTVVVGANDNTGGTFKLTYGGHTTAVIAYNATAATVQAAFCALPNVGVGNCVVSGGPASTGTLTFTFVEGLGGMPITAITGASLALTGGTNTLTINATATTGVTVTPGTYTTYASGNSDGSQTAKAIAMYDLVTDSSGNIYLGAQSGASLPPLADGVTSLTAPVFVSGVFQTVDLVGLDSTALSALYGRFETGNITDGGVVRIP